MKVIVRQPRRREVELQGDWHVRDVLKHLDLNPETFIVIQGKKLLTQDSFVRNDDTIEVLSAISGGT